MKYKRNIAISIVCLSLFIVACTNGSNNNPIINSNNPDVPEAIFSTTDLLAAEEATISSATSIEGVDTDISPEDIDTNISEALSFQDDDASQANQEAELSTQTVLPSTDGILTFIRTNTNVGGNLWQIWIHDQATDTFTKMYQGNDPIQSAATSPRLKDIYASIQNPTSGKYDIYRLDYNNSFSVTSVTQVTATDQVDEINVSVDRAGRKVVWEDEHPNGKRRFTIADYDWINTYALTHVNSSLDQVQPSLSGNGHYVSLIRKLANGNDRVVVYDTFTNEYPNIIGGTTPLSHPSITDDGISVLFGQDLSTVNGRHYLRIKDVLANTTNTEAGGPMAFEHPHTTSKGAYITFGRVFGGLLRILNRNVATNNQVAILGGPWDYYAPHWQQDNLAYYWKDNSVNIGHFHGGIGSSGFKRDLTIITDIGSDDNFYLSSSSNRSLYKYASDGTQLWSVAIPALHYDTRTILDSVVDKNNNNLIVIMYENDNDVFPQERNSRVQSYDTNGNLVWEYALPGASHGTITVDSNSNVYLGGFIATGNYSAFQVVKVDSLGNYDWELSIVYNSSVVQPVHNMAVDSQGNVFVAGQQSSGNGPIYMQRINANGTEGWYKEHYTHSSSYVHEIMVGSDDQIYYINNVISGGSEKDGYVSKVDNITGDLVWSDVFSNLIGTVNTIELLDITMTASGDIYVVGSFRYRESPFSQNVLNMFTAVYDNDDTKPDGGRRSFRYYDYIPLSESVDVASGINVDSSDQLWYTADTGGSYFLRMGYLDKNGNLQGQ